MPWAPVLARLQAHAQAPPDALVRLAADREQLIGSINVCQQCLGELLQRLHAAEEPARDAEGVIDPAHAETVRARTAIEATLDRLGEVVASQPTEVVHPAELDALRAATEELSARLARLDGAIEERMLRTADLAARGAEIVVEERLKGLRGETEAVRTTLAGAVADVRSVLARLDAGRGSELAAVRVAIAGVRADVARLETGLDDRVSRIDAAWRALDADLANLRARLDAMVASSSTGGWLALARVLWDPIGELTAAAGWMLGRLALRVRA